MHTTQQEFSIYACASSKRFEIAITHERTGGICMDNLQKAQKSIEEAIFLLKYKSTRSTMVERYLLLHKAWDELKNENLSQPLQM